MKGTHSEVGGQRINVAREPQRMKERAVLERGSQPRWPEAEPRARVQGLLDGAHL